MLSIIFILYQFAKNKPYWLNIDNQEGVNFGLILVFPDIVVSILAHYLYVTYF
jgi:uncharacterized membrane protein (DUF485 family)